MAELDDTWGQLEIDPAIHQVEMKITARVEDEDQVVAAARWADSEPESREIFFFDTSDLRLFDAGVLLRARRVHDGVDDSTVKLRPVDPKGLSRDWLSNPNLELEVDVVGKAFVYSVKLSSEQDRGEIGEVASGEREIRKLFTTDQERLLDDEAPLPIPWHELGVLGPVTVQKWEMEPKDFPYGIDVEEWVLPDRSNLVELSIKVDPSEGVDANSRFVGFLQERGIDTEGDQKTKTRTALEYFVKASRG
jgi:hypothetical protein